MTGEVRVAPLSQQQMCAVTNGITNPVHAARGAGPALNVFATLARNTDLYHPTVELGRALVNGRLRDRDRELVVLRVAVRLGARYMWAHHCHLAVAVGVEAAELSRLGGAPSRTDWSEGEHALLVAVDELTDTAILSEGTWSALTQHLDEQTLIELISLIGEYQKIAFLLNSLGVAIEDWAQDFPEMPEHPAES